RHTRGEPEDDEGEKAHRHEGIHAQRSEDVEAVERERRARAAAGRAWEARERLEETRRRARVGDGEERRREDDRESGERPERAEAPRPRRSRQCRMAPASIAMKTPDAARHPQQITSGMRIAPIAFPCVVRWR